MQIETSNVLDLIDNSHPSHSISCDIVKVKIGNDIYKISEQNGKLEIRVDGNLIINPSHCNNLYISQEQ